jgi:hypothetical protein
MVVVVVKGFGDVWFLLLVDFSVCVCVRFRGTRVDDQRTDRLALVCGGGRLGLVHGILQLTDAWSLLSSAA